MTLHDCERCGVSVRLGAQKVRIDGRAGVAHYIAHTDGSPMHDEQWNCVAMKPYPRSKQESAWWHLCDRWNKSNDSRIKAKP